MPFLGMGKSNCNAWFPCHFISGAVPLTVIVPCTTSFLLFSFVFFFFLSTEFLFSTCWTLYLSCFVFFFYRSYLFCYFCRRLRVSLIVFLYFWSFFTFVPQMCTLLPMSMTVEEKKKNYFKNPHFLLRRKHLAFIYLCMEDTWYFIPVASGCTKPLLKDATKLEYNTFWKAD